LIFLDHGDPHRSGRSLLNLSTVQYFTGELEAAMATLHRSLEHLDLEREPRLRLYAGHNLADYLTLAGRFEEAQAVYRETRPLYRELPEPWVENRRKWVRARILRGLGRPRLAESLLLAVRDGFLAEDVPFDTALVSLEIAGLYAEQGRTGELKQLAREMLPVFASLHIHHREALAALAFLLQAIQSESASAKLVAAVASYLRQAEHDAPLPFRAPEP
jgi:tetratricopeptide (TPR) repeat protein